MCIRDSSKVDWQFLTINNFITVVAVSYTHLDVYKRQVESSPKNVSKEVLEKLDYLIGNALRNQDVENRLPQIQREIESSLQVGF